MGDSLQTVGRLLMNKGINAKIWKFFLFWACYTDFTADIVAENKHGASNIQNGGRDWILLLNLVESLNLRSLYISLTD